MSAIERIPVGARRVGYRVAHAVLVVVSFVLRPHTRGVKCALVHGDRLLLVRHTYGSRAWDLPGGFCRRGEPFADAARRELREELGVVGERWTDLGGRTRRNHGRHEGLHLFRLDVERPEVTIDPAELEEARWFALAGLPADRSEVVDEALAGAPR